MNDSERIDLLLRIDGAQSERIDDLVARVEALERKASEPEPAKAGAWSERFWDCDCGESLIWTTVKCYTCGYERPPIIGYASKHVKERWFCHCISHFVHARLKKCDKCGCERPPMPEAQP